MVDRRRDRQHGPRVVVYADGEASLSRVVTISGEVGVGVTVTLRRLDDDEIDARRADRVPADLGAAGVLP